MNRYKVLIGLTLTYLPTAFAATPLDLSKKSITGSAIQIHETQRSAGPNHGLHVRAQQTYLGYPVLGADVVMHMAKGSKPLSQYSMMSAGMASKMSGTVYQGLEADLVGTPDNVFTKASANKALQIGLDQYGKKVPMAAISQHASQPVVYVDKANKAHFAHKVSFYAEPASVGASPSVPTFIVDANTFQVHEQWDGSNQSNAPSIMMKASPVLVRSGGVGGNEKTGPILSDGLNGNLQPYLVTRDAAAATCYMKNPTTTLKRNRNNNPTNAILSFPCASPDAAHNNVYWSADLGNVNGGYSPANDAMTNSTLVRKMFNDWYAVNPILDSTGKPTHLSLVINYAQSNAVLASNVLSMGDGSGASFPATTRDLIAHEIAHGITNQSSKLGYGGQAGAINESFCDMSAKLFEYYMSGTTSWTFGGDLMKQPNDVLRYMDQPTKDCNGGTPGDNCSIDNVQQYTSANEYDTHAAAGVYNKFFYLLSTSEGWDIRKAYDVMLNANMHYWTSASTFNSAACGVLSSAADYEYDATAIKGAFSQVGIDTSAC